MTSQQFTEQDTRYNHPARRPTVRRGLKKRGALPSFGDMILPVVGVFAVVLLVIAGRQFFLNGLKSSPGIASTRAYASAPAVIAERERSSETEEFLQFVKTPEQVSASVSNDTSAEKEEKAEKNDDLLALAVPLDTPKKVEFKPVQTTKKAATPKSSSNAAVKKTPQKSQAKSSSNNNTVSPKQWRVQVGAYTSRAGAQEAADKIKKAGYRATVYSNPASKHFKVWVQGGADKKSADNVVKAMQKLGYKGSFSFPPAK